MKDMHGLRWEQHGTATLHKYVLGDERNGTYRLLALVWHIASKGWRVHIYDESGVGIDGVAFYVPDADKGKQMVEDIIAMRSQG